MNKWKIWFNVVILWILFIKLPVLAECYQGYCRSSNEEMFLQTELKFISDMYQWKHAPWKESKANKCEYHISSIAYWFSVVECSVWKSKMADETNNRHSVKKWTWKYRYNWKEEFWYLEWSNYLKYPNPFLSTLDYMYLYKYGYLCDLSYEKVVKYKMWAHIDDENSRRYYRNLIASIQKYERKYFSNKEIDDYNYFDQWMYKSSDENQAPETQITMNTSKDTEEKVFGRLSSNIKTTSALKNTNIVENIISYVNKISDTYKTISTTSK